MKQIDTNALLTTIGHNLHTIRNARKETLQAVAAEIGITHPIISKIENGTVSEYSIEFINQIVQPL
jgi:transcriptional regulator with XRE-family HTH domain